MAEEHDNKWRKVGIGLDFGSSTCAVTLAFYKLTHTGERKLESMTVPLEGDTNRDIKNPTVIVYKSDGESGYTPHFYGKEAVLRRYHYADELCADNIKLNLHEESRDGTFRRRNCVVSGEQAMRDYLQMCVRCTYRILRFECILDRSLHFVMTTPSKTPLRVRELMRKTFREALIEVAGTSIDFTTAFMTEPLAVVLHHFESGKVPGPEEKVLVADVGGGTSDVVLLKMKLREGGELYVQEIAEEGGILKGGIHIDKAFFETLEQFQPDAWRKFIRRSKRSKEGTKEAWDILWKRWQDQKLAFDGDGFSIDFPSALSDCMPDRLQTIKFTPEAARKIFDPTYDAIIEMMGSYEFDRLLLAGASAENKYYLKKVTERFGEQFDRVRDPHIAVCNGAVIYARNPHIIGRRILQRTYGIGYDHLIEPSGRGLSHQQKSRAERIKAVKEIYSVESGKYDSWTDVVKLCKTVGQEVDTQEWHDVQTIIPNKLGDTTISVEVYVFDAAVPDIKDSPLKLPCQLPPGEVIMQKYTGTVPDHITGNTVQMQVKLQFKADGVRLKAEFSNERIDGDETTQDTHTIHLNEGT